MNKIIIKANNFSMKEKGFMLSVLAFLLLVFFCVTLFSVKNSYSKKYVEFVNQESLCNGVNPNLIFAIIKQESNFNEKAVSKVGAVGLMQLMPQTAEWVAQQNGLQYIYSKLFEPSFNIKIGTMYFKYLLNKFNDIKFALCAYNAGEGVLEKWLQNKDFSLDKIPYKETKNFVKSVMFYYEKYELLG